MRERVQAVALAVFTAKRHRSTSCCCFGFFFSLLLQEADGYRGCLSWRGQSCQRRYFAKPLCVPPELSPGPPAMIKTTQVILFSVTLSAPPMHYRDWFSVNSLREAKERERRVLVAELRRQIKGAPVPSPVQPPCWHAVLQWKITLTVCRQWWEDGWGEYRMLRKETRPEVLGESINGIGSDKSIQLWHSAVFWFFAFCTKWSGIITGKNALSFPAF